MPNKEVVWAWDYGVYVPFCPYCGEPAYEHDKCVFCGRTYNWVEGEYQPTVVEVGEYTVVQSTNNNISVYDKGNRLVFHINCNEKKTEAELAEMVASVGGQVSK